MLRGNPFFRSRLWHSRRREFSLSFEPNRLVFSPPEAKTLFSEDRVTQQKSEWARRRVIASDLLVVEWKDFTSEVYR